MNDYRAQTEKALKAALALLSGKEQEAARLRSILATALVAVETGGSISAHPAGYEPERIPDAETLRQLGGISVTNAADILQRDHTQIRRWCEKGELIAARDEHGRWVIDPASARSYVPRQRGKPKK